MKFLFPVGIGCLVVGMVLLIGSATWTQVIPSDSVWDREQALELEHAASRFHQDTFDESIDKVTLEQSRIAWEEHQQQLDRALTVRNSVPYYLRVCGIACLGVAASLILVHQHNQNQ